MTAALDTLGLTVERSVDLLDSGEISCRELVSAYLDAIEMRNGELNAYVRTRADAAIEAASRFDRDGRSGLQGVPIAYKDILCTRGEETTAGSRILAGHRPLYDAGAVQRGNDAGLVSLGKTNMDEFAMGSSTEHSAFGPTHNPWDVRPCREDPAADRPRRLPPGWLRSHWAPIPAARSASRPRCAAWWGSSRPMGRCRGMG